MGGFGISHLLGLSCCLAVETSLGASLSCVDLLLNALLLGLDGLHVVNGFGQNALVLELVTLGEHVQGVVNVFVNLLGVSHLLQKAAKDTLAAHPQHLHGQTGVGRTTALTGAYSKAKR